MIPAQRPFGNAYKIAAVKVGGAVINGTENSSINHNINKTNIFADGAFSPRGSYVQSILPGLTFDTKNFDVLKQVGWLGKPLAKIGTGGIEVFAELLEPNATIMPGATHIKWMCNEGVIYPTKISLVNDGVASISFAIQLSSQAQIWPLAMVKNVALPTLGDMTMYGMGPMVLNGRPIDTMSQIEIDFNSGYEPYRRQGDGFARCHYGVSFQPKITSTMDDITEQDATKLGVLGVIDLATSAFYFRQRLSGGLYFPDEDAVHVKMSFGGDSYFPTGLSGGGNGIGNTQLIIDVMQRGGAIGSEMSFQDGVVVPSSAWVQPV